LNELFEYYETNKNFDKLEKLCKKLKNMDKFGLAYYGIGLTYRDKKDLAKMEDAFLTAANNDNDKAALLLGNLYSGNQNISLGESYYLIGEHYKTKRKETHRREAYEKAIKNGYEQIVKEYGLELEKNLYGYDTAYEWYETAMSYGLNIAYVCMGDLHLKSDDLDAAIKYFEKSKNIEGIIKAGKILMERGIFHKAVKYYNNIFKIDKEIAKKEFGWDEIKGENTVLDMYKNSIDRQNLFCFIRDCEDIIVKRGALDLYIEKFNVSELCNYLEEIDDFEYMIDRLDIMPSYIQKKVYNIVNMNNKYSDKINSLKDRMPTKNCCICYDDELSPTLKCGHDVCISCYDKINICPLCRAELS